MTPPSTQPPDRPARSLPSAQPADPPGQPLTAVKAARPATLGARIKDHLTVAALRLLRLLPYPQRMALAGWAGRVVMPRVSRIRPRVRAAVLHLFPDLPESEVAHICARVPENLARSAVELVSGRDLAAIAADAPVSGPGWDALQEAQRAGRPALLLIAHFGNFGAVGAALKARGFRVGAFYNPLPDPATNRFYTQSLVLLSDPLFPSGREGVARMVRHLRGGGMVAISNDLDRPHGVMLDFLGKPARTVLSMAEMALKYNALLVPVYGIRRADGLHFDVTIDTPVPHGDPAVMTQALNDSLGRMVTLHKDQWLWWHRRWKDGHPADATDTTGPEG